MIFSDALVQMKEGKYVKRTGWEDGFCCIMPDIAYIWRVMTKPTANVGNFLPLIDDILASDWEVYTGCISSVEPVSEAAV